MSLGAKAPHGVRRSPKWAAFERAFLRGKSCEACDGRRKLVGHHVVPFHKDRSKELDESNVIALCEGNPGMNCHLMWGHLGNFKSWNVNVRADVAQWRAKIAARP